MGISILPPSVNKSLVKFSTEGEKQIRIGLTAVKNVGESAVRKLVVDREVNGDFSSFGDFLRRSEALEINKKMIESLILSSAMDEFGIPRSQMLGASEPYLNRLSSTKRQAMEGQISIFSLLGDEKAAAEDEPVLPNVSEFPLEERLAKEKEMLGLYISGHPLDDYKKAMSSANTDSTSFLKTLGEDMGTGRVLKDKEQVTMAGLITSRTQKTTKTGKSMCFLRIEDLFSDYEVIVFPESYGRYGSVINASKALLIRGRVQVDDEAVKLILEDCVNLSRDDEELCQLPPARSGGYSRRPRNDGGYEENFTPGTPVPAQADALSSSTGTAGAAASAESGTESSGQVLSQEKKPAGTGNTPRLAIRYFGHADDEGYKRLLATCSYFHGSVTVYVALPKEKRNVRLSAEYSIEWSREVCNILIGQFGIENVSLF